MFHAANKPEASAKGTLTGLWDKKAQAKKEEALDALPEDGDVAAMPVDRGAAAATPQPEAGGELTPQLRPGSGLASDPRGGAANFAGQPSLSPEPVAAAVQAQADAGQVRGKAPGSSPVPGCCRTRQQRPLSRPPL